jgi:hypothetical protein
MTDDSLTALGNSAVIAVNNLGTSVAPVIGSNPTRKKLTFHAPGGNDIIVFPTTALQNIAGGGSVTLSPNLTTLGGGFRVFANGGDRVVQGRLARQAWQALAIAGTNQPLTITEE